MNVNKARMQKSLPGQDGGFSQDPRDVGGSGQDVGFSQDPRDVGGSGQDVGFGANGRAAYLQNSQHGDGCAQRWDPYREGVALTYGWRGEVNWINPPWGLLDEVAHKLQEEGAGGTVVATYWPGQARGAGGNRGRDGHHAEAARFVCF
ncbi:hypothetical protein CYMTET_26615 [Cymbomonas tetramitiformis]|uniref:Uncharacterized protein n=1 Tax=Cymbomonas tetramitiformis TaxID=36881 RepID=A0AAE0KXV1_9CHLO|nr:hypothetical protein CYMTET_26615 [Cymbomonas tetramitiformis]